MPNPSLMACCDMPRVWHTHRADCPVRLRALERRKNVRRAEQHSHETRRAGVETTPLNATPGGTEFQHWNHCTIPECQRCEAFETAADRGYDELSGA
jgi:hypothetical protein